MILNKKAFVTFLSIILILEHASLTFSLQAFRDFAQQQKDQQTFEIMAENFLNKLAFKTITNKDFEPNENDLKILTLLARENEKRLNKAKQANSVYWLLRQG